jgi:hypothetical protein
MTNVRSRSVAGGAAASLLLLVALGACSGGDDGSEVASVDGGGEAASESEGEGTAAEPASEEEVLDYFECLRSNGVDIEDPTFDAEGNIDLGDSGLDPGDVDREALQGAQDVCGEFPQVAGGMTSADQSELEDGMVELAECMRDQGIDMPDPDFDGGAGSIFGDIDTEDPEFQAAFDECRDTLGGVLPERAGEEGE